MKGVLLARCPDARVVDLCHGIGPQDVRAGAFALMQAVRYFPDRTLFVCVVDPGVGSPRRILWATDGRRDFLAPDNGLLSWAGPLAEVRAVTARRLFLPRVGSTFDGRDVFAPVAAALASGLPPAELGPRARRIHRIRMPRPRRSGSRLRGEVLAIDRFGNAVTNIAARAARAGMRLRLAGAEFRLAPSYSAAERAAVRGSSGFVELALRGGSLAAEMGVRVGDRIDAF